MCSCFTAVHICQLLKLFDAWRKGANRTKKWPKNRFLHVAVPSKRSCDRPIRTRARWRRWDRADSFHQESAGRAASVCETAETQTPSASACPAGTAAAVVTQTQQVQPEHGSMTQTASSMLSECISLSLNSGKSNCTDAQTRFFYSQSGLQQNTSKTQLQELTQRVYMRSFSACSNAHLCSSFLRLTHTALW